MAAPLFGGVYSGRRVLITGHTGFKGSWLAEWLIALGADVIGYALDPPTVPSLFVELGLESRLAHHLGDVRDLSELRRVMAESAPEIVFHMAAQPLVRASYTEPVGTYETNVMGTVNVLEAARAVPSVRAVVIVTSDKCYENRETGQAYRETDAMGGHDPYSSSKGCAELVTSAYRRSFFGEDSTVAVASVRAGNVIGGGDWAADRVVPDCVRALEAGEPVLIRNPGAVRPWQHVLDPLAGYLLLASLMLGTHRYDGAWNFGPDADSTVTVGELADAVVMAWGSGSWVTPPADAGDVHEAHLLSLDTTKARSELGWLPLYDAARTLDTAVAWYRARSGGAAVVELTAADIAGYVAEARARGAVWAAAV